MKKYTYFYKLFKYLKHFKSLLPAIKFVFTILKYAYLVAIAFGMFQILILGINESHLVETSVLTGLYAIKSFLMSVIQRVSLFLIKQFCNPEEVLEHTHSERLNRFLNRVEVEGVYKWR